MTMMDSTEKLSKDESFEKMFQRYGSVVVNTKDLDQFSQLLDMGFTGETYADFDRPMLTTDPVTILHFNDVYNIEPAPNGQGGISRFVNAMREFNDRHPLVLFSGDVFNPSMLSISTRGRHMVPFLNMLKVHTACVGNHDFDFGIDQLEYLIGSTQCPWVLSNVFDAYSHDRPAAGASLYRLFEWQGHKIGIIGLVEYEWITTLAMVSEEDVIYRDFVQQANDLAVLLRSKECDLIVALTHMRSPNDERLAKEAHDIDIILGGHDHDYYGVHRINKSIVAKSGTDFREFTVITIYPGQKAVDGIAVKAYSDEHLSKDPILIPEEQGIREGGALLMPRFGGGSVVSWECVTVDPDIFPTNRHVDKLVSRYLRHMEEQMEKQLGVVGVDLDTRFRIVRTQEANSGNWVCDLMRSFTKSDVSFINSGTIRADAIIPAGAFRMRDLVSMLPMPDALVVIQISGEVLLAALENGVCMYPILEGRFLQVSGIKFSFDGKRKSGERIIEDSVEINRWDAGDRWEKLDRKQLYNVCTKEYLIQGKDGFSCLVGSKVILDAESTPILPTMLRNSFVLQSLINQKTQPHNPSTTKTVQHLKTMTYSNLQKEQSMRRSTDISKTQVEYYVYCAVEGRIKPV